MQKKVREEFNGLIDGLREVLHTYSSIDPSSELNPVDAFFAYRLLIGRNPEASVELPGLLSDRQTFRLFLTNLLDSAEFSQSLGFLPPNRTLMSELGEFRFWFNTSDREMGVAMAFGLYEPSSVTLIKKIVRRGMRCLDIGAQTGFFTCLMASRVGETGKVHAFEPMPSSNNLLRKNIEENRFESRVNLYQLAASNVNAAIEASQTSNMYVVGQVNGAEKVKIEAVRIDDIIEERIDVIKIDVEGHEPAAIEGMKFLISRYKPIIISEANEYWLRTCSESNASDYVQLLSSLGYNVYNVEDIDRPLLGESICLGVLDKIDVIAFPQGHKDDPRSPITYAGLGEVALRAVSEGK